MKWAWAIVGAGMMYFGKDPYMVTRGLMLVIAACIIEAIDTAVARIKVK